MTRRALPLALFLLLTSCLSFAQRSGASGPPGGQTLEMGRMPTPEDTICELVVHIVSQGDFPLGEHINVRVDSANGGTVAEGFTNEDGKVKFGVRVGAYIIRVRGSAIKEVSTGTLNIESFEKLRHEYIRVQPSDWGNSSEAAKPSISATELKIPEKARQEFEKGNEALSKGDKDKAIQHFQKAVELYPQFVMAYNNMAAIYMQSKDVTHAREALNKALEADPNLSFTQANIVRLELMERNFAAAIALSEKALTKEPNNPEILFLMCEAQLFSSKFDQALLYARKVIAVPHDKFERAHIFAGRALEAQNHPDQAKVEYEALLKESPNVPEAAEARRSIARLESVAQKP